MDILLLRTENVTWDEISGFLGSLDSARRKGVMKKATETDRINSLLSRLLLLSEIEKRAGIPRKKIAFTFGTQKKPYMKNNELYFSLSHTKGAIIAAFSETDEIGADVECTSREINERMFARVLSDEERKNTVSSKEFLRLWVQKEAFMKRIGLGITRDLRTINPAELPDTAAIDCGEFIVGVSGKGALDAVVLEVPLTELLARFVKEV